MLTKVKETLPLGKQSNVYIMQLWPGLHWGDQTETGDKTEGTPRCRMFGFGSACMENHHPIHWEETTVLDHGRGQEEFLHIQMTPSEEQLNQKGGLEVPGCWTTVWRRQEGRSNPRQPSTSNDVLLFFQLVLCSLAWDSRRKVRIWWTAYIRPVPTSTSTGVGDESSSQNINSQNVNSKHVNSQIVNSQNVNSIYLHNLS